MVNSMVKVFPKKEGEYIPDEEAEPLTSMQDDGQDEMSALLGKLVSEEACLREQRENLSSLKEQLQLKAKEEIELKKNRIQKLKLEITDLKGECDELTKSLRPLQACQPANSQ
jgi:predicted RNase H-like nuclease (RuvC/YqgF family)